MKRFAYWALPMIAALMLGACRSHPEMQHTPQQYAKLRGIELLTSEPTRSYEVVANVQGTGGRHTAKETMINSMIDAAQSVGARALIPMEPPAKGGAKRPADLDAFVYFENNRRLTKGRAIRWTSN